MDQNDLLRYLVDVLERLGLRYAVTGSHASMIFGEPRFTHDIDVIVELTPATLRDFCQAFPEADFYVSDEGARTASIQGGMFNIIHPESGLKIDVIVPGDEAGRQEIRRAVRALAFGGREVQFVSPEDLILNKMAYYREGGSEKHLRDITGVLKVSGDRVDRAYIADWAEKLGLTEIWQAILKRLS